MHACNYACMYVRMYVCMYVCMYAFSLNILVKAAFFGQEAEVAKEFPDVKYNLLAIDHVCEFEPDRCSPYPHITLPCLTLHYITLHYSTYRHTYTCTNVRTCVCTYVRMYLRTYVRM